MRRRLRPLVLTILAGGLSAAWAQDPAPDESLQRAQRLYDQGLKEFRAGRPESGRASLAEAFSLLLSELDEETLPESLRDDFAGMLDKTRHWDEIQEGGEAAPDLAVSAEALEAVASTSTVSVKMRGISADADNPLVARFVDVYTRRRPGSMEEALARSGRYRGMILAALREKGLPPQLFHLVMTESEFKHDAVSRSRAAGLWQFMPETARRYGLEVSYWVDERYAPEKATGAAVRYLHDLYQWFGDWDLALAAYNRGEGGLGRDMRSSRSPDFSSLAGRGSLPAETHYYVPKFKACVLIGENPERYGLRPRYEAPEPYDVVTLPRALDLEIAARCAQAKPEAIRRLNPQLRAWCTPKNRPDFALRVPQGSKEAVQACLAQVKDWSPGPALVRYRVMAGDSLGRIARRHRTTVKALLGANTVRNPRLIRPGMLLLIPPGRR